MLNHEQPAVALTGYFSADKVALFDDVLKANGPMSFIQCEPNHDSALFDTVACYIRYDAYPSGMVWEFYYYLDEQGWKGTNLGIIQTIPQGTCPANITFAHALGQGIDYDAVPCSTIK